MSLRFSLLGLVALLSFVGLACAALVRPGPEWLSVVVSLTVLLIGYQSLRAILERGPARAAAIGWLMFALAYLALTIGPWLGEQVGPKLLSSRALAYAQSNWRKESTEEYSNDYVGRININHFVAPTIIDGTTNTLLWTTDVDLDGRVDLQMADRWWGGEAAPFNCFRAAGHWLSAWVAGCLGGTIAVMLQQRAARQSAG